MHLYVVFVNKIFCLVASSYILFADNAFTQINCGYSFMPGFMDSNRWRFLWYDILWQLCTSQSINWNWNCLLLFSHEIHSVERSKKNLTLKRKNVIIDLTFEIVYYKWKFPIYNNLFLFLTNFSSFSIYFHRFTKVRWTITKYHNSCWTWSNSRLCCW